MAVPGDLQYTKSHEWVRVEDGVATVGITDHAQTALGDVVFVDLPEVGREVGANEACAVVESVKAASDVYAPLAGRVVEANARLADDPGLVNRDPTGEGWFYKLEIADAAALDELMDEAGYQRFVESQA